MIRSPPEDIIQVYPLGTKESFLKITSSISDQERRTHLRWINFAKYLEGKVLRLCPEGYSSSPCRSGRRTRKNTYNRSNQPIQTQGSGSGISKDSSGRGREIRKKQKHEGKPWSQTQGSKVEYASLSKPRSWKIHGGMRGQASTFPQTPPTESSQGTHSRNFADRTSIQAA